MLGIAVRTTPAFSRLITPSLASIAYRRAMSTLFEAIKDDHKEMYEYHDQYLRAKERGDVDAQARWTHQLRWEISRHAVSEEIVVYPLMEKHLGSKGKELADHDREEHQSVKEHLYKLEQLQPGSDEYHTTLTTMMQSLHHHNDDEEINDLPLLRDALSTAEDEEATRTFKSTKKYVPTRAHPSVPTQPLAESLIGISLAPLDKLYDRFATSFPHKEEMAAAKEELKGRDHDAAAGRAAATSTN